MYHPITTKQHSFLDYAVGLLLPVLPNLLGAKKSATHVMRATSGLVGGQTMMTDFEGGKFRYLPMQAHLANDALVGMGLLTAAALLDDESPLVRGALAGLGLVALGAALLTEPIPRGKGRARAERTARKLDQYSHRLGEIAGA